MTNKLYIYIYTHTFERGLGWVKPNCHLFEAKKTSHMEEWDNMD